MFSSVQAVVRDEIECFISIHYDSRFVKIQFPQPVSFVAYVYDREAAVEKSTAVLWCITGVRLVEDKVLIEPIRLGEFWIEWV